MKNASRRDFVRFGLAAGAGGLAAPWLTRTARADTGASPGPLILNGSRARPVLISSRNGQSALTRGMDVLRESGDTLEAVVSAVNLVEADPEDMTVGYGGLPNAEGVVQLDSQVWHGPTRGAGAVAALEGYVHPSRVAMAVMRYTDHVLLVGRGAGRFAREFGFDRRELLTKASRSRWLAWRARQSDRDDYLDPDQSGEPIGGFDDPGGEGAKKDAADEVGLLDPGMLESHDGMRPWGTIHCSAVSADGDLSAVTTTSGLFFKIPGRVGDSPLPGCGCYADNDVGAAGSTGRGEAVIKTVGAHTIVEAMRTGSHPTDACLEALRRIVAWTVESRLLQADGRPNFNVNYYAVNKAGDHGGAAIWSGNRYAAHEGDESRLFDSAYLFDRKDE